MECGTYRKRIVNMHKGGRGGETVIPNYGDASYKVFDMDSDPKSSIMPIACDKHRR